MTTRCVASDSSHDLAVVDTYTMKNAMQIKIFLYSFTSHAIQSARSLNKAYLLTLLILILYRLFPLLVSGATVLHIHFISRANSPRLVHLLHPAVLDDRDTGTRP